MLNFVIHHIGEIPGRIKIFKLQVDGLIPYDVFEEAIKRDGNFEKELINVQAILKQYAEMKGLPDKKFKPLQGCTDAYTEFEIKTKNLRVYLFKEEKTGSIIVCGGKKNTQRKDISEFLRLKRGYIKSKQK
jgi:putative component of toxin-antitoxin plasmid stabilization module